MEPSSTDDSISNAEHPPPKKILSLALICALLGSVPFLLISRGVGSQPPAFYVFLAMLALLILWPHALMVGLLLHRPTKWALGMAIQGGGAHVVLAAALFTLLAVVLIRENADPAELRLLAFWLALLGLWGGLNWALRRAARTAFEGRWPEEKGASAHCSGTVGLAAYLMVFVVFVMIALPGMLRSRMLSNEKSAVASLRTLKTLAELYNETYANEYPQSLALLGPTQPGQDASCTLADMTDAALAAGRNHGYVFEYRPGPPVEKPVAGCPPGATSYVVTARPTKYGGSGVRSFHADEAGVMRLTPEDRAPNRTDIPFIWF